MSVMEGSLSKWTNVVEGWQYRWFVLDENAGLLSYYTSKEKMMRGVRRGCVRLKAAVIGIDDEDESTFTITVDHKTFHFQARDGDEREKWVRALEDTILRHVSRARWESSRPQPTIKDFDNKVAEADAYLQIMIEQTKAIEERIPSIPDIIEQDKYKLLKDQSNVMLDDIKHSIVLLQIAKNTAYPVNGIYQGPSVSTEDVSPVQTTAYSSPGQINVETGIELATDCMTVRRQSNVLSSGHQNHSILVVPETSYSSSEGEDDFYDAHDDPFTQTSSSAASPTGARVFSNDETQPASTSGKTDSKKKSYTDVSPTTPPSGTNSPSTPKKDASSDKQPKIFEDGSLDYDALYEDIAEDDSLMESHGSVITHLISQIKIGMDLTKVVLPTFILERRSLLEMYADYFAHPDLFVSIADIKDPKDRMVQVVRWYLASYHAGRKSAVAKKPYNPILGEVFKCHWNIPNNGKKSNEKELVTDGPIPWCTKDQLTFVAEQVSHHPPVSAFYAEHYNKRISFCAYVYTKSKFLGLSVCVYNIGVGIVTLPDYDEQYTVTFPNGYGRSILTVPWIELGGPVKIACEKTGYHADVEFLTKPFYSNKKHRITADVYGPADPKVPFLKIAGEWNGVMEGKVNDGQSEVFVDVDKLSVIKKMVEPIAMQEENESRRVWKEVTAGLKFNDIEKATQAKSDIEDKQRTEAKDRVERNLKWETKLFQPDGETWEYTKPLSSRLKKT